MNVSVMFQALIKFRRVFASIAIVAAAAYEFAPMIGHSGAAHQPAASAVSVTDTNSTLTKAGCDLGEVALTNNSETCVQLGGGKDCILSPKLIDGRNLEITFAVESKMKNGKIHDLSVAQIVTRSGTPVEIAVGDLNLSFTPKISAE